MASTRNRKPPKGKNTSPCSTPAKKKRPGTVGNIRVKYSDPLSATYRQYGLESLDLAINAVISDQISANRAAKIFGVPVSTLKDRLNGKVPLSTTTMGHPPLLSKSEESDIVRHVQYMASVGCGHSRKDIRHLATDVAVFLKKRYPSSELLSDNWVTHFLKRWPELTLCKARTLESVREKYTSRDVVDKYYCELEVTLIEHDVMDKPHLIYVIDEIGITTEYRPTQGHSNSKPQAVVYSKSGTTTIVSCGNAEGATVPPFFVFKGKRFNEDLMQGNIPGATGTVSDSGWSNSVIFKEYLETHFIKSVQKPCDPRQKVLILYDGHRSHVCKPVIDWALDKGIVLFVLPPHCSHILQPLNIDCFSSLKSKFHQECQEFMSQNPGRTITRYDICSLSCKAYLKGLVSENLVAAFQRSGIVPFDKSVVSAEQRVPTTGLQSCTATNGHGEFNGTAKGQPTIAIVQSEVTLSEETTTSEPRPVKRTPSVQKSKIPDVFSKTTEIKKTQIDCGGYGKSITSDINYGQVKQKGTTDQRKRRTAKPKSSLLTSAKKKPQDYEPPNKKSKSSSDEHHNSSPASGPSTSYVRDSSDDDSTSSDTRQSRNISD